MVTRFAVFGDVHGHQNVMYDKAREWMEKFGESLDAILQVGDFETIMRPEHFEHYYAPAKYHHISDLREYAEGVRNPCALTVFTGGNHEAWSVLAENKNGGFVCPRIYYLGLAGTLDINGITIAGLTGIFSRKWYNAVRGDHPSYDWKYYRREDVEKLRDVSADILLLHEWPQPVDDSFRVLREQNVPAPVRAGTPTPAYQLVKGMQPRFVFAGHLHKASMHARINGTRFVGLRQVMQPDGFMHVLEIT
ncbi:metallophosphoesterase [Candidatus Woesearchaeota archaeon]|nr:metallophosphoesterase [Candidatus Woesearchaeota archaeon]